MDLDFTSWENAFVAKVNDSLLLANEWMERLGEALDSARASMDAAVLQPQDDIEIL